MTWADLFGDWELVGLDLADIGVDIWDRDLMRSRPGVWLRSLIVGLLERPPLGYFEEPAGKNAAGEPLVRRHPIWPNRVQVRFNEPLWARGGTA